MVGLTQQRIVERARAQIEDRGFESISLRALARDLDVTAPALYDHIESKGDLLRLVAQEGYTELAEQLAGTGGRAIDRLRHRARAYVGFALANPELFRLMFQYRPDAIPIEADNALAEATASFEAGVADIRAAIDEGDVAPTDPESAAMVLWSAVHGVATVELMAPGLGPELVDHVIDTMLRGLAV